MATNETYSVTGMTCDHCARAVASEISAITGVNDVSVDVATGEVAVLSDAPLDRGAVREAVEEAGFSLAS